MTDMSLKNLFKFLIISLAVSVESIQNKYCQLSCDYGTQIIHTICERNDKKCGPHERCGLDFKMVRLTDMQRESILHLHNHLRNTVAIGNETRGDQPKASNMNILKYNKELEFIAQCWANTCNGNPLIHDVCRRTDRFEHVGQNLGFINSSLTIKIDQSIDDLVMLWYDEVTIFNNTWINETEDRGEDVKVGHYTQMMWADTSEIGCAISLYTTSLNNDTWNHMVLVCNYGPGGNYLGLPVYEIGEPLSNCLGDWKPSQDYEGLCAKAENMTEDSLEVDIFELY